MDQLRAVARPTLLTALVVGVVVFAQAVTTLAQPPDGEQPPGGRGGRGGFGGFGLFGGGGGRGGPGGGGLSGLLRRDSVKEELKITPEQEEQIREVSSSGMPDFRALGEKMRNASEEDRVKIGEEMRLEIDKRRKESDEKIKKILKPEQFARLEQLSLQESGLSALRDDALAATLKLTDEQKNKFKELLDSYDQQVRGSGFGLTREERDKLRTDRDASLEKLLTAEQKQQWEAKLGPPAIKSDTDGSGRRRERTGPMATTPRPPVREEKIPDGTAVVASLTAEESQPAEGNVTPDEKPASNKPASDKPAEKLMSFNFRFAPWEMVLKHFAEHAGLTLDLNVVPPGTFNYFDDGKFTVTQALDVLNGYLLQKGYLLVRRDKFLVVVSTDAGIPPNLVPQIPLSELPKRGRFELVSVLLPLDGMDPDTAADEAQELLGPQGKIVPLSKSGRLLVTDVAGNIQRIHELLNGLTGNPAGNVPVFQSFQLKHVSVMEAEKVVRDLFGLPQRVVAGSAPAPATPSNSGSGRESYFGSRWSRDQNGNWVDSSRQPPPTQQPAAASSSNGRITVATDLRTNTLMITAKPDDLKVVESALKTLDIDDRTNNLARNLTGRNSPQLEVYPITTADSRVVIQTINNLVPSAIVSEDTKAKRLHVFATSDEQSQIKALIEQIDGGVEGGETALVVQLRRLDPLGAAGSLRNLFKGNREEVPMIEADAIGRRLMIRGTTSQVNEIKVLLKQMGEDPDGGAFVDPNLRGPVRTLSLGGRDPSEFVELLKQVWPARDTNPIRIVVPSAIAPTLKSGGALHNGASSQLGAPATDKAASIIKARDLLGADGEAMLRQLETVLNPKTVDQELEEATQEEAGSDADDLDPDQSAPQEPAATQSKQPLPSLPPKSGKAAVEKPGSAVEAAEPAADAGKPVVVAPSGSNLIIASDDLEALDRLQAMIEALALSAPKRTTWTVFYLRTADATETATMLGHLFPSGSVSQTADPSSGGIMGSLTGGLSSFGSSLMDMTGLANLATSNALRIVPEVRSNALYVSGPSDLVRQVEDVLKVLDASELPESMRDRVPRMIPVEHADVDEVSGIIENVYKDYMTAPAAIPGGGGGSGGGFNPLAMLMAAGGGGGDAKQKRGIRLTLGVDRRTNSIVVSADESLFRQVEALVKKLDQAALEANRTIRVVTVNQANSHLVQQALGSLMGKVRVSTTGGGSAAPVPVEQPAAQESAASGQRARGSRGATSGDDPQRALEQQMRERFLQGAGLLPPQSGGGRGGGNGGGGFGGRRRGQ